MAGSGGILTGTIFGTGTGTDGPFHNVAGAFVGIPYKTFQNLPAEAELTASTFKPTPPFLGEGAGVGRVFIKDQLNAWVYTVRTRSLHRVRDEAYPSNTVHGQAWLNGRIYVCTPQGQIFGSSINDPTKWSALDNLFANANPDLASGIAAYKGYVVVFGTEGLQFFYDSGEPVGNPLRRVDHALSNTGCWDGTSIQLLEEHLYFAGYNKAAGRGVYRLQGFEVQKVSTPSIDRICDQSRDITGGGVKLQSNGHSFYLLNLFCLNHTLVYDATSNFWSVWGGPDRLNDNFISVDGTWTAATDTATGYTKVTIDPFIGSGNEISAGLPIKILQIRDGAFASVPSYLGEFVVHERVEDVSATLGYRLTYLLPGVTLTATSGTIFFTWQNKDSRCGWFAHTAAEIQGAGIVGRGAVHVLGNSEEKLLYYAEPFFFEDTYVENAVPDVNPDAARIRWPVPVYIRTDRWDMNTNIRKFLSRLEIVGDASPAKLYVRYSDDDGVTYVPWRQINMSVERPHVNRLGSARRRIWEILWFSAAHLRVEGLEAFGWMGNKG